MAAATRGDHVGAARNFLKAYGPEGRSVTGYGLGGRKVSAGVIPNCVKLKLPARPCATYRGRLCPVGRVRGASVIQGKYVVVVAWDFV